MVPPLAAANRQSHQRMRSRNRCAIGKQEKAEDEDHPHVGRPQHMGRHDLEGRIDMEERDGDCDRGDRQADPPAQAVERAFFLLDVAFDLLARVKRQRTRCARRR